MKRTFSAISLLVVLAMVLGACAQPTAAPAQPTAAPAQPTAAPAQPTAAPAATFPVGVVLPTKDEPRWIQDQTRFQDAF
jgi:PBP1b-binding outer membrane lipoprotein LpoB